MTETAQAAKARLKGLLEAARRFVPFAVIGAIGVGLNVTIYKTLLYFSTYYLLASTIAWILSLVVVFILNRTFTFKSKNPWLGEFNRTVAVYSVQQAFVLAALYVAVDGFSLDRRLAYWLVLPPAVLVSFFGLKLFAMRQSN